MKKRICCIVGHRSIELSKVTDVKKIIREHIIQAINDGYTHFISGFSEGIDLYFAEIVAELKSEYDITLEADIAYRNKMNTKDIVFKKIIHQCDIIKIFTEEYTSSCYMYRNRLMIQASERIIAVYDGREKGGTLFAMRYANVLEKEIEIINIR